MNTKKIAVLLLIIASSITLVADQYVTEKWFQASELPSGQEWSFEFKNKEKKPLYLRLFYGEIESIIETKDSGIAIGPSKGSKEQDHSYFRAANVDPKMSYELWISYAPKNNERGEPDYKFIISKNNARKKIFLTWENKKLRAQSGTKGKTQSGLDLSDNVKRSEITAK